VTGRLRLADVERIRYQRGNAVLLFLTDRCPVGCLHCSVDSRRDSPRVRDHELLRDIVGALAATERLSMVGISGGEPFIERRALSETVAALAAAGKHTVLYTSGVWAKASTIPAWITGVLGQASCLFLSTDAYHAATVDGDRFVAALRAIADAGTPIVVQVLDREGDVAEVTRLLNAAFGAGWDAYADLSPIPPLPYGRGATFFGRPPASPPSAFGTCRPAATPVVRYDGVVTGCCNEGLVMGRGPVRLREPHGSGRDVADALERIWADPFLRVLNTGGTAAVTAHPRYADLASGQYRGPCDFCAHAQSRTPPLGHDTDRLLAGLAAVTEAGARRAAQEAARPPETEGAPR
jgi:organic radical activating enzyme